MLSDCVSFTISFCVCFWCVFFFFKQKTAYEMRISDWSSDVCSSDLGADRRRLCGTRQGIGGSRLRAVGAAYWRPFSPAKFQLYRFAHEVGLVLTIPQHGLDPAERPFRKSRHRLFRVNPRATRSEEHTSELPSLMRTSDAGLCLKKKKNNKHQK